MEKAINPLKHLGGQCRQGERLGVPRRRGAWWLLAALVALSAVPGLAVAGTRTPAAHVARALAQLPGLAGTVAAELERAGEAQSAEARVIQSFYRARHYKPLWIGDEGPNAAARAVVEALHTADRDGLDPKSYDAAGLGRRLEESADGPALRDLELGLTAALLRYAADVGHGRVPDGMIDPELFPPMPPFDPAAVLKAAAEATDLPAFLNGLAPSRPAYASLRAPLVRYRALAAAGGWPTVPDGPSLKIGMTDPRVEALRRRLRVTGELTDGDDASQEFDETLEKALKVFQRNHGLDEDGAVGPRTLSALNVSAEERVRQIVVTMERWRHVPANLGSRYIMVNIPAAQMEVWENGAVALAMRVVVGQPRRPTPVFKATMTHLILNPRWNVPRKLAVEDVLEKARKDQSYMTRLGIRVFSTHDGGVTELDPSTVDWQSITKSGFPYVLRQEPGPKNAMGRMKFVMPNRDDIYLHDTPQRHLFQRASRAESSGCIRLEKPVDLASYLLRDHGNWTREKIEATTAGNRTEMIPLQQPLTVYLAYRTVWVDEGGVVQFRSDLYGRDKTLMKALFGAS